jgi:hypothetical protein
MISAKVINTVSGFQRGGESPAIGLESLGIDFQSLGIGDETPSVRLESLRIGDETLGVGLESLGIEH